MTIFILSTQYVETKAKTRERGASPCGSCIRSTRHHLETYWKIQFYPKPTKSEAVRLGSSKLCFQMPSGIQNSVLALWQLRTAWVYEPLVLTRWGGDWRKSRMAWASKGSPNCMPRRKAKETRAGREVTSIHSQLTWAKYCACQLTHLIPCDQHSFHGKKSR